METHANDDREHALHTSYSHLAACSSPVGSAASTDDRVRLLQERIAELERELAQTKAAGEMLAAISMV